MAQDNDFEYIDFEVIKEPWNLYELEDNSILKFKLALVKVIPIANEPKNYKVNTANIVGVLSPKELRGTPTPKTSLNKNDFSKKDLTFKVTAEDWSEYKLKNGTIVKIKPAITEVNRTTGFDDNGEPIYVVRSTVLIKLV